MNTNPLLHAIKFPGKTVKLPSQGMLYKDGVFSPDVKNGEIHVHPLTAIDEIMLKSPDFLLNGEAIDIVFRKCMPQIEKPLELFTKDFDYLMMVLRQVTFGNVLEFDFNHNCENSRKHEYRINLSDILTKTKSLDPTTLDMFCITLDNNQTVYFHPLTIGAYMKLNSFDQISPEADVQFNYIAESLINVIEKVTDPMFGDIDDKEFIKEWLGSLPAEDFHKIVDTINQTTYWGTETSSTLHCMDCENDVEVDLPLNPVVFFSRR